jgi:deoxyribose-phosphate aldolase
MTPAQKADECADAEAHGAKEMEIAGNTRETKSMNRDYLVSEMRQIKAAVAPDTVVKYIIEIEMLSDAEAVLVCEAAAEAGIDWIVTSTGEYCTLDENKNDLMLVPTAHEVNLIRKTVGSRVKVQAEGNIVCARTAIELINAGADRISTPCPAKLIREFKLLEEQ